MVFILILYPTEAVLSEQVSKSIHSIYLGTKDFKMDFKQCRDLLHDKLITSIAKYCMNIQDESQLTMNIIGRSCKVVDILSLRAI